MSMTPQQSLKLVLTNIFRKRGGSGIRTKLFVEFSPAEQQGLLSEFAAIEGEEPVLACIQTGDDWTVITTDRVVSKSGPNMVQFELQALVSVRPAEFDTREKRDWKALRCDTLGHAAYTLRFESGASFFAVWNVLKHVVDRFHPKVG
jgi:hypothetical protein